MSALLINGNALQIPLADESVQCVVTSPPYWGLRDYGVLGQLGLESTPDEYIAKIVDVFREVWRVLRDNGTLWLNLGDTYAQDTKWGGHSDGKNYTSTAGGYQTARNMRTNSGLKSKDMVGIPWRVAFALQADGWYLRSDIIWHKPNPMPESVSDRPTKCHEYIFLLTKNERYYYDAEAIKEPVTGNSHPRGNGVNKKALRWPTGWDAGQGAHSTRLHRPKYNESYSAAVTEVVESRNKRSVWTVPTFPYPDAHFATYPPALIRPCILAGSWPGDVVLDPFCGSGTTGAVAIEHSRHFVGVELNREYIDLAMERLHVTPRLMLEPDHEPSLRHHDLATLGVVYRARSQAP